MKYARQTQDALDRVDVALNKLYQLVKRGNQSEALLLMEEGELKDRYEELQNIINISYNGNYGARGVQNTGRL